MEIYPSDHYMQDFNGVRATRPAKKASLIRTRRTASGEDDSGAKCAVLSLENDLESMTKDWDKEELAAERRLVRFTRIQDGAKLLVSCATVRQEDYAEGDTVVSCIYRKETDGCYVTSVDIILLLERLVGHEFDIEEKNRIRRNLEGFRPKTVSKNRPDSSEFFLQIMNFPAPKPRNIEKDLKVFDWAALPQALEKIISRYVSSPACVIAALHSPLLLPCYTDAPPPAAQGARAHPGAYRALVRALLSVRLAPAHALAHAQPRRVLAELEQQPRHPGVRQQRSVRRQPRPERIPVHARAPPRGRQRRLLRRLGLLRLHLVCRLDGVHAHGRHAVVPRSTGCLCHRRPGKGVHAVSRVPLIRHAPHLK